MSVGGGQVGDGSNLLPMPGPQPLNPQHLSGAATPGKISPLVKKPVARPYMGATELSMYSSESRGGVQRSDEGFVEDFGGMLGLANLPPAYTAPVSQNPRRGKDVRGRRPTEPPPQVSGTLNSGGLNIGADKDQLILDT